MKMYNKKLMLISAYLLLVSGASYAKMKSVNSRRDFEQTIAKESMVVALFYDENDKNNIFCISRITCLIKNQSKL